MGQPTVEITGRVGRVYRGCLHKQLASALGAMHNNNIIVVNI